jgi:acyl-CoA thioesterase FadM
MTLKQDVYRDEAVLVSMTIRLASLNEKGQITAIPKEISALMVPYLLSES